MRSLLNLLVETISSRQKVATTETHSLRVCSSSVNRTNSFSPAFNTNGYPDFSWSRSVMDWI